MAEQKGLYRCRMSGDLWGILNPGADRIWMPKLLGGHTVGGSCWHPKRTILIVDERPA